jgi:hypothetical protein
MFQLTINTENEAFKDGNAGNEEIARILRELASGLHNDEPGSYYEYTLRDMNGNSVGTVTRSD